MATIRIPLNASQAAQSSTIRLGDSSYVLHVVWNEQMESWYVSIDDSDGNTLLRGQRLSVNFPLNLGVSSDGMPPGMLLPVSMVVEASEIVRGSFDKTAILTYTDIDVAAVEPPAVVAPVMELVLG